MVGDLVLGNQLEPVESVMQLGEMASDLAIKSGELKCHPGCPDNVSNPRDI